jgi:SAM-dependent methyltransferase
MAGYRQGDEFAVLACEICDYQRAWPCRGDAGVYAAIYSRAGALPGYARYARYAAAVVAEADPLAWLSRQEAMYWFVADALARRPAGAAGRVVEIGSGLGYLTHALRRAGYDATGLDIAAPAVAQASDRFGPHFRVADALADARASPASADVVVMLEVLEHLEDPFAMLGAVASLLRPGGTALVSTPNKSWAPGGSVWLTERPPVHLWWFSEAAARRAGHSAGLGVRLQDFTGFNRVRLALPAARPPRPPPVPLDARGEPVPVEGRPARPWKEWRDRALPAIGRASRRRGFLRHAAGVMAGRTEVIGLVLEKRPDG